MLINALIYTLECGFDALIQSTGNIKNNQIGFSLIQFMLLPVAYMLYSHGASVYSITIVNIILSVCVIFVSLLYSAEANEFHIFGIFQLYYLSSN